MKKFYKEHRVFMILMAVVIVCAIIIGTVLFQCFYVGSGSDKYGNRLENISSFTIEDSKISEMETKLINEKIVKSSKIEVTGKIIYVSIVFEENATIVEAESLALKSLEEFTEEEMKYYDVNFTLKAASTENSDGFLISGAKNKNGSGLVWNNNRSVDETTE